jgi:shikimate kinase
MEAALARELGGLKKKVIATGGRLMLDAANAAALSRRGRVFTLWATPEEIIARVANDTTAVRPLLEGPSFEARIRALFEERRAGYARFTPIETSGKTITEVVQLVLNRLADDAT